MGASTIPTNTLAAATVPTGPLTPMLRPSNHARNLTTFCRMPQWYNSRARTLIITIIGSACSASTKPLPGIGDGKRCRGACQITEQKFHAGAGCCLQCNDSTCEQIKDKAELRDQYEQACDDELQRNSTGGKFYCVAHGKGIALFR